MATNKPLQPNTPSEAPGERLDSWKEIAAYLRRDERTVRRWEEEGLPVHRKVHRKQASVYAYRAEIDAWWNDGRTQLHEMPVDSHLREVRPWFRSWPVVVGAVCIAALVTVALVISSVQERKRMTTQKPSIHSLAVLPLENLSGDPGQEFLAEGITEELTTQLAQLGTLEVISHTSASQYLGTKKSLPEIGRELGVDAVIEGAVERIGDRIEITVQLIEAPTDRHLFARSYDRSMGDLLAAQREVTQAVVQEIEAKRLTEPGETQQAAAVDVEPATYEWFLRGRFSLERGELRKSIAYFEQAIQVNPAYAPAYAGLANAYISMGQPWYEEGDKRPVDVLPLAKEAATKAVKLDEKLAEGHLALARIIQLYEWNWTEVEKEYRRTLELNQNDALAHGFFAEFLQESGRTKEALDESRRARALDPLSAITAASVGYMYYTGREYDAAMLEFEKAMKLAPDSVEAHLGRGWVFEEKKMYPQAIVELEEAVKRSNGQEVPLASLGEVLGEAGRRQEAARILRELKERARKRYVSPCLIAMVELGLGEREEALASLETGFVERDQWLLYLKVDPHLDALRSDPRFNNLLKRMRFEDTPT